MAQIKTIIFCGVYMYIKSGITIGTQKRRPLPPMDQLHLVSPFFFEDKSIALDPPNILIRSS